MSAPAWLRDYYGKDFDSLAPTVVRESRNYAVVRLFNHGVKTSNSRVGYVLVYKKGSLSTDSHSSLFEGIPEQSDMDRMYQALEKKEETLLRRTGP